jgi:4-alpha-glucanotransferase
VPPDAYSATGQLWGNPLYDWPALRRQRYGWWIERLRRTFALFDLARIDHFRGFAAYWAVPAGARDARAGVWRRGPGRALFHAARRALGDLPLIAEDLGEITPAVVRLRREEGLPGMVVLQFAFNPSDADNVHDPANHEDLSVCYTGTHDNDTLRGWWETLPAERRALATGAIEAAGVAERRSWWSLIGLAHRSPARLAMVQAQDVLGLGGEARMNLPGRAAGAWKWRLRPGQLTKAHARRLREITAEAGRLGG